MFVGRKEHKRTVLVVLISLHLSFYQVQVVFQCAKMFARSYWNGRKIRVVEIRFTMKVKKGGIEGGSLEWLMSKDYFNESKIEAFGRFFTMFVSFVVFANFVDQIGYPYNILYMNNLVAKYWSLMHWCISMYWWFLMHLFHQPTDHDAGISYIILWGL